MLFPRNCRVITEGEEAVMKKNQYHTIVFYFIFPALICMPWGCSKENEALKRMEQFVPENALCYLHVGDPDAFFESIDSFFEPLGGLPAMGPVPVKDFIETTVESTTPLQCDWFDFTKPWGCAVIPSGGGYMDVDVEVYIPLIDAGKYHKKIEDYVTKLGRVFCRQSGNYLIVSTVEKKEKNILSKKGLDLKELAAYEASSVSCYVNTKELFKGIGGSMDAFKENVFGSPELRHEFGESFNEDMTVNLLDTVAGILGQVEQYTFNLRADGEGITWKSMSAFTKEGSIHELNTSIKPLKGIKGCADRMPSRWLYSTAYNLNREFRTAFMEKYMSFLLSVLDVDEALETAFLQYLGTCTAAAGSTMSVGFDLDVDTSGLSDRSTERLLKGKGKEEDLDVLSSVFPRLIKANALVCMEMEDKKTLRTSVEKLITDDVLQGLFDSVFKATGISWSVSYKKDLRSDGFLYDEISFVVSYSEQAVKGNMMKPSSSLYQDLAAILDVFFKHHPLLIHWGDRECYMVLGSDPLPLLKAVAEKKKYPQESLVQTEVFRRFSEKMPDDAHVMGHLSLKRLFHLASQVPLLGTTIPDMTGEPGILWYMRYHNERWETVWFWDMEEIAIFYAQLNRLMGVLF
jgi:hypothetical protein